ncbi:hypothetical protein [uncultured Campylobacter sp.]|uniref:hypothetical protein n=1 Tax=uncultured Campylobacter sp. TaxID=218934 RepID=UPI0026232F22|nr:hypothetical protein [uncultured Campylobacter sp.]
MAANKTRGNSAKGKNRDKDLNAIEAEREKETDARIKAFNAGVVNLIKTPKEIILAAMGILTLKDKISETVAEAFKNIELGFDDTQTPFKNVSEGIITDLECRLMFLDVIGENKEDTTRHFIIFWIWRIIADYVFLIYQITKRNNTRDLKTRKRTDADKKALRLQKHLKALKEIYDELDGENDSDDLLLLWGILKERNFFRRDDKERAIKLINGRESAKAVEEAIKAEIRRCEQMEKFTNTHAISLFCDRILSIYENNATQKIKTIELTKDIKILQTLIKNIADHVFKGKPYKPISTL